MTLVLIGYWRSDRHPEWPDPRDFVDPRWDQEERHVTRHYLSSGTVARAYMGLSECRLCGAQNGALEFTDGTFLWPQGLAHYVDEHAVRLPQRIVDHAVRRIRDLEDQPVDDRWWRDQATW